MASADLCHDGWLLRGWFGLKHTNVFIYISIYMTVFVKTRKSGKHCLALKTKPKPQPRSNTQSSMQYSLWVKILLMLHC